MPHRVTTLRAAMLLTALLTLAALTIAVSCAVIAILVFTPEELLAARDHLLLLAIIIASGTTLVVAIPFCLYVSLGLLRSHRMSEEIKRLADMDPLTGLLNRAAALRRIDSAVRDCVRHKRRGALLFVDLDHFKKINDAYGHAGGDAALRHAANTMREVMDQDMILGRFGGEEFVCFIEDAARAAAAAMALNAFLRSRPCEHDGRLIPITASIGLAVLSGPATAEDLLSQADEALYLAKSAGRDRVVHHEDIAGLGSRPRLIPATSPIAA